MRRIALAASVALIIAATLVPFEALQTDRAPAVWCLVCEGLWLTDAISNIVLFIPLGVSLTLLGVAWTRIAALSLIASLCIEFLQSLGFPPGRSASLADVLTNALGGLVGVWLLRLSLLAWRNSPRAATQLSLMWAVSTALACGATSVALGARTHGRSDVRYTRSPLPFTPGFGWFGGLVDSASVNGFVTTHQGTGPVMVEASSEPSRVEMTVTARGRQEGTSLKPMVFVHRSDDTTAIAFIGERDLAAELVVTRRAWDWGLAMPSLTLPGAFATRTVDDARPIHFTATSSIDQLELAASAPHFSGQRTLWLTPLLGWAMIQTLITIDSPMAIVACVGWLALLVVPMAWWGARAGSRWWMVLGTTTACLVLFIATLPRITGVAPVAAGDWAILAGLLIAATLVSRWLLGKAPHQP